MIKVLSPPADEPLRNVVYTKTGTSGHSASIYSISREHVGDEGLVDGSALPLPILHTSFVTTAESPEKPVAIVESSEVIAPLSSMSPSMSASPKDTLAGEDAYRPWTTDYVPSQVPISGLDTKGMSEWGTMALNSADRLQQPSIKEAINISPGSSSTVTGESTSYDTNRGNSRHIPIPAVGSPQTPASEGAQRHTTAPNAASVILQPHNYIGLSIYATHETRPDGIMHTHVEETQADTILSNLESQILLEGGASGLPDPIDTGAAHVLTTILPSSEEPSEPSVLPLASLALGPRPYPAIPDTGEPFDIASLFLSELGRISPEGNPSTAGVSNLLISGKHATDILGPGELSHSTVKTYQKAAIGPATSVENFPDHQSYYTASTPRPGSAPHSNKVASILHHFDTDAPGAVPLLRIGQTTLSSSSAVDSYRLSDFHHLTTRLQSIAGSFQNTIGTIESSTASISSSGSSGQKILPATKIDVSRKPAPNSNTPGSKSVSGLTAGLALAKDSQILSSTWTTGLGGHSTENIGQPDATNLAGSLPSSLSENSGRSTDVAPETSAGAPFPGGSVTSDALHNAAASHNVNKRSALFSIGAISGAVCLFAAIFEWARRRSAGRRTIQIEYMKTQELRWRDPNRSYFSLDSSTQL